MSNAALTDSAMPNAAPSPAPTARPANSLVTGPILPALLKLTAPNLAAMVVVTLVAICETIYVGILGTTALAAIALVFPMIMLMQMLSAGAMGGGVSSAISRALGAGDVARAEALALHAVVIGAAAGLFFSVVFALFGAPILRALGGSDAVLQEAVGYAGVALTAAILTWLLNTFASIVRGTGNITRRSSACATDITSPRRGTPFRSAARRSAPLSSSACTSPGAPAVPRTTMRSSRARSRTSSPAATSRTPRR